jgi:VWFA-related protein
MICQSTIIEAPQTLICRSNEGGNNVESLPRSGSIGIGDPDVDGGDREALEKLCEPTGGRAFVPRDVEGLDQAFEQLERELRQQYLEAYEPANMAADGKYRKIEARIANRKDIRARHGRGYYGPGT